MKPSPIEVPDGWEVESSAGFGPFTSLMRLRRPDGSSVTWTSRSHRKELDEPGVPTRTWWIAVLFCIGSTCFTVGPMPWWEQVVGAEWAARTFFVGSNAPLVINQAIYAVLRRGCGCAGSPAHGSRDG